MYALIENWVTLAFFLRVTTCSRKSWWENNIYEDLYLYGRAQQGYTRNLNLFQMVEIAVPQNK